MPELEKQKTASNGGSLFSAGRGCGSGHAKHRRLVAPAVCHEAHASEAQDHHRPGGRLRKGGDRLAIEEVVHNDDVYAAPIGRAQHGIAVGDAHARDNGAAEVDAQER